MTSDAINYAVTCNLVSFNQSSQQGLEDMVSHLPECANLAPVFEMDNTQFFEAIKKLIAVRVKLCDLAAKAPPLLAKMSKSFETAMSCIDKLEFTNDDNIVDISTVSEVELKVGEKSDPFCMQAFRNYTVNEASEYAALYKEWQSVLLDAAILYNKYSDFSKISEDCKMVGDSLEAINV